MSAHPSNADTAATARRNRKQFWLLVAIFFGPMLVAMWPYFGTDIRPPDQTNHGVLNSPARPLPDNLALQPVDGEPLGRGAFEDHWTLVQVLPAVCDEACKQGLYLTRQVWLSLDRRRVRVQRLALIDPAAAPALAEEAARVDPNLQVLSPGPDDALAQFLEARPADARQVYLIDPIGNWVMSYPPGWAPAGMLKDMKKLLKISRIG